MQLSCPHCHYSRQVAVEKLPASASRAKCPQCGESFPLPPRPQADPVAHTQPTSVTQRINCPVCGKDQPQADAAKLSPKAGFWLRLVALMIDGLLVLVMQVVFGLLLVVIGSEGFEPSSSVALLTQLFSMLLSLFYWVFFTGYCGQTPGKMLLRLQVVRTDGQPLGYGKAFYRETLGKFVSGILLGIGYLMAAFDDEKQALHDRMAGTFVIKL